MSTADLVSAVLSQVQTEFSVWSWAYTRKILRVLAFPPETYHELAPILNPPNEHSKAIGGDCHEAQTTTVTALQTTYSPDEEIESVSFRVIDLAPALTPHPLYESCSPSSRNVFKGDDDDSMAFIPYADDPLFDQIDHTHCYGSFSWQGDFDPDRLRGSITDTRDTVQVVLLEAAYRLHTQFGLAYEDIERCGVFPLKLASHPGKPGLLAISRRRDRLDWTGNSVPADYVFPLMKPTLVSNFRHRIQSLNTLFCPNLNCVEPLCSVHGEVSLHCSSTAHFWVKVELNTIPPCKRSPKPLHQILAGVETPCKDRCFLGVGVTQTPWKYMGKREIQKASIVWWSSAMMIVCNLHPMILVITVGPVTQPIIVHVFRAGLTANAIVTVLPSVPVGHAVVGVLKENLASVARAKNVHVLILSENVTQSCV
ncbi:hypothetical protein J3A83DRAFT_4187786 [Scleroderma citrinum]